MTYQRKCLGGFGATLSGGNMARGISILTSILLAVCPYTALAQSSVIATPLPNAKQTFVDGNGKPLTGGKVFSYVPNTSTAKTTWSTTDETIANANPVTLDSAGRAVIFGQGNYRQVLQDAAGNTIWDSFTTAVGSTAPLGASGTDTAPVGTVMAFTGFSVPTNWALAYGQTVLRASYAQLLTTLTITNAATSCVSGSATLSGLVDTGQMALGEAIESACLPTGTTISGIPTSTTLTVNHNATATGAFSSSVFPWGNGDGTLTFNLPDLRGRTVAGADAMGGTAASRLTSTYYGSTANAPAVAGGSQSHTLVAAEAAVLNYTSTVTDPGHAHVEQGGNSSIGTAFVSALSTIAGGATSSSTSSSTTGITVATSSNAGGGAHAIVQPTLTVNYIIKLAPNSSGAGGVVSLGGMFGDIICGANLTCAGGVISASGGGGGGGITSITAGSGITLTPSPITTTGSVALTVPVTVALGGTGATNFTSNAPLIGGGAGALGVGTRSGSTTTFATSTGALTNGHCVSIDGSGNFIDAGGACTTGGGGGTVSAGTTSQLAYYATSGTIVSGLATGNNGTLITSNTGVPSISSTLPSTVQGNITALGTITSGTWNGTAIDEQRGGTHQTTYATGDLLYASASNTLSKLTGNTTTAKEYLQQVGTGSASQAPSWSQIDLANGVSGTLAFASLPLILNNSVLGNVSGFSGNVAALNQTQLTALISNFSSSLSGSAPASGGGTVNFLRADGTWAAPGGGGGGISGPGSAERGGALAWSSTGATAVVDGKGPCNVLAWGASTVASGATNTAAINAAIASCGTAYIPAGTYACSGPITVNVAHGGLIGDGMYATILSGCGVVNSTTYSRIGNMRITGNTGGICLEGGTGSVDFANLYNLELDACSVGLHLGNQDYGFVTNVVTQSNSSHGVSANGVPGQWQMTNVLSQLNSGDGFHLASAGSTTGQMRGLATFQNGGYGFYSTGYANVRLSDSFFGTDTQDEVYLGSGGDANYKHTLSNITVELGNSRGFMFDTGMLGGASCVNCISVGQGLSGLVNNSGTDISVAGGDFVGNGQRAVSGNTYGLLNITGTLTVSGVKSVVLGAQTLGVVGLGGSAATSVLGGNIPTGAISCASTACYAAGNY